MVGENHMHRIKTVFIALAIIVIATISFRSIVIAAEVTRINKNRGLIVINGNKDDGFVMGANVCFYSSSGEEITCGSGPYPNFEYLLSIHDSKAA
jgi:hypothetical protein